MNANKTLAALLSARILKGKYNNRSWLEGVSRRLTVDTTEREAWGRLYWV